VPALGQFLGSTAGLSAAVITRLTGQWQAEQRAFAARDLSGVDYVYLWLRHEVARCGWLRKGGWLMAET
jgi:hypothetical protein